MAARVVLVRHGHTKFNAGGELKGSSAERLRGWKDVPLDSEGKAQAKQIAARLGNHNFHVVVCSSLSRAIDTGRQIARATGAPLRKCLELRPWDVGDLAGKRVEDVKQLLVDLPKEEDKSPPGGEPFRKFRMRFLSFLLDVLRESEKKDVEVCLVSHTRNLQLTRAWLANKAPSDFTIDLDVMNDYANEVPPGHDLVLVPKTRQLTEDKTEEQKDNI
jgi:broad specificity phosphatase PhoE